MSHFSVLLSSQAHTLRLPKTAEEDVERFVLQHQTGGTTVERAPFLRKLDFWAFGIVTAVARGLDALEEPSSRWGKKFVDTRAVQMPGGLCDLLAVLALTQLGPEHPGLDDPAEIIELGNRLAGAGVPVLLARIQDPDLRTTALDKALDFAAQLRNEISDVETDG